MEERKRAHPLGVAGLILLYLILIFLCFASLGLKDWSLGVGHWGIYSTDGTSVYLAQAYEHTGTDDLLLARRDEAVKDGDLITYQWDGRRVVDLYDGASGHPVLLEKADGVRLEPVRYLVRNGGLAARELYHYRWYIRAALVALIITRLLWRATAEPRWLRAQQKLFVHGLKTYGEQYLAQDETADY